MIYDKVAMRTKHGDLYPRLTGEKHAIYIYRRLCVLLIAKIVKYSSYTATKGSKIPLYVELLLRFEDKSRY